ncbi:MAG: AraC family transcriptional regulator [Actinomycetia bacterium]|nr:AraC family transcriptional regulator [Actinomycetes bacterium]
MPAPGDDLFADMVSWLQAHLNEDITVADLAARSAMSPRTFARRFVASSGTTPGLGSAANLRKQFGRALATSPQAYRRTFAASAG